MTSPGPVRKQLWNGSQCHAKGEGRGKRGIEQRKRVEGGPDALCPLYLWYLVSGQGHFGSINLHRSISTASFKGPKKKPVKSIHRSCMYTLTQQSRHDPTVSS